MHYLRKILLRPLAFMLNPQTPSGDIFPLLQMDCVLYISVSHRGAAGIHITN
jgi:hypothetical protein